jgi:pteridine reductase
MQKNILITGAAKRIGAACARLLHEEGCNILIHYRSSEQEAKRLCSELNALRTDSAVLIKAELADMAELERMAGVACQSWGGVDVLINNASAFYPTPFSTANEMEWDDLLNSNLKAPFFLAKLLSDCLSKRQGSIINITDIHADRGLHDHSIYCIAKAGLTAATKILAKELAPGVRVNAIAPGAILWPETSGTTQDNEEILGRIPLARCGSPEDIAKAALYLVKDAAYTTGQILTIDGGRTLFY